MQRLIATPQHPWLALIAHYTSNNLGYFFLYQPRRYPRLWGSVCTPALQIRKRHWRSKHWLYRQHSESGRWKKWKDSYVSNCKRNTQFRFSILVLTSSMTPMIKAKRCIYSNRLYSGIAQKTRLDEWTHRGNEGNTNCVCILRPGDYLSVYGYANLA